MLIVDSFVFLWQTIQPVPAVQPFYQPIIYSTGYPAVGCDPNMLAVQMNQLQIAPNCAGPVTIAETTATSGYATASDYNYSGASYWNGQ